MSGSVILLIIVVYFSLLLIISFITGRKSTDNDAFFLGNKKSPWWIVAIGMVGSSISGVSFVSVPGMVRSIDFTYMQTVFGFFFGYLVIANVLLPLYYKLNLTSIYTYLGQRFGKRTYKTGVFVFSAFENHWRRCPVVCSSAYFANHRFRCLEYSFCGNCLWNYLVDMALHFQKRNKNHSVDRHFADDYHDNRLDFTRDTGFAKT